MSDDYLSIDYNIHLNLNRMYSIIRYILNKPVIRSGDMIDVCLLLETIDESIPNTINHMPLASIADDYDTILANTRQLINEIIEILGHHPSQPINITRLSWIHESIMLHIPELGSDAYPYGIRSEQSMEPAPIESIEPRPSSPISISSVDTIDTYEFADEEPRMRRLSIHDLMADFEQEPILIPTISEKMVAYENYFSQSNQTDCIICMENAYEKDKYIYVTRCDHIYCKSCFETWKHTCTSNHRNTTCAMCRSNVNHITIYH